MDEAENNSAAVRCHHDHTEEAPSQERGFIPQEVLHKADSGDTGKPTIDLPFSKT
jgi:hypothetical protein